MLYQVKDLSPEQRRAAEILLGHPVSENEAVSIKSLGPATIIPSKLSPEDCVKALRALEQRFATANRPEVGQEEEEAIVDEALRSTRANYRPAG
jgi:DNA-binding NarL/FixJ family response regulator